MRLSTDCVEELKRIIEGSWNLKYSPIGGHPQKRCPNHGRNSEGFIAGQKLFKPGPNGPVVGVIGALDGKHDIDIQEQHLSAVG